MDGLLYGQQSGGDGEQSGMYALRGVVLFDGKHYTAVVREHAGGWTFHDDE